MKPAITPEQRRAREEYVKSLTEGRKMYRVSDLMQMRPDFQRTLRRWDVGRIVREWQPHRFDEPVVVICSDGREILDDGQHRVAAAALKLGLDAEIRCKLAYTDKPGEEFVALNSARRAVTQGWKHIARVSDGDETAIAINTTAARHGFTIGKGKSAHAIGAINAVTTAYNKDPVSLDRTLGVLADVIKRRDGEPGWLRGTLIQAVWYVIRTYDVDDKVMARNLAKTTPDRVVLYETSDPARNAGTVIVAYNKQLPEDRRLNIAQPRAVK